MGSITSAIGLVSGIDSGSIIEQLTQLERRPIKLLQSRITQTSQVQLIFAELTTRLNQLKSSGSELRKPSTFEKSLATSSNEDVLGATAGPNTPAGTYNFRVARLVSSQQLVTSGFATADKTPVGEGTVTVEMGDGRLDSEPTLDDLRGGAGVRRGTIEIIDSAGRSGRVDLSDAVTLDDVVNRLNTAAGVSMSAKVEDGAIILNDLSGGTGDFKIRDVTGHAAEDLGLLQTVVGSSITGASLSGLSRQTALSTLNDGRGVATGASDGLTINLRDRTTFDVDLSLAQTLGDVVDRFNDAAGGKATMEIVGSSLRITDTTTGPPGQGNATTITGKGGSTAAAELGIASSSSTGTLDGTALAARPGSVLLSSLNGGAGLTTGTLEITNAAGTTTNLDLTGAVDVAGLIEKINDANAGVRASLNDAGNGIDLVDTTGGSGSLVIADVAGTLAAQLGWDGTHEDGTALGNNLQKAWLTGRTLLTDLNAGRGISLGKVKVTDSSGATATFNFGVGQFRTVDDVLSEFNRAGSGVDIVARINDNGDGIIIEDGAGGAFGLKIEDETGGTAADLRLAGTHASGAADGSYEVSFDVSNVDSLEDLRRQINNLNLAVRAEVLNTGGGTAPFRLSVVGRESGRLGAFVFDARLGTNGDSLQTSAMGRARDAALFLGSGDTGESLLVTSGSNSVTDVIPGLTLDLKRPSHDPVTVTVERDTDSTVEEVEGMVEAFNALREMIDKNSKYNEELDKRGLLLGEPSVQKIENQLYRLVDRIYDTGNPRYRILRDVGIKIADGAKLEFDEKTFRAAWADDPQAVKAMFSTTDVGFGFQLRDIVTSFTDPTDGLLTNVVDTLKEKTAGFEEQIARIEDGVQAKRARLEKQFLDMELALSKLQFQQQQIASIPNLVMQRPSNNNNNG